MALPHQLGKAKVPPNLKQRESVKLKGSVKKGKQEPRDHHQTQHSPNSLALLAIDSLELKLAHTAINDYTKTLYIQELRWSFSVMRDEQSVQPNHFANGTSVFCFFTDSCASDIAFEEYG